MTKWLPTVLPILLVLATALSTTMQNLISTTTASHPWLATAAACAVWIVNHWLTPPTAAK
jgi:hypothetical protein